MQLNAGSRELVLKVVYYGPGLSGKTTNLQEIHARLDPSVRGRLMVLDTADDRTLFFDLLPVFFETAGGLKVKIKLFTVPGQVMHDSTRRLVLQGADGVVFVADSQRTQSRANTEYWQNLMANLRSNGLDPDQVPTVIQFNKRDLPDIRSDAELAEMAARVPEPVFTAVAIRGEGVLETLHGLLREVHRSLETRHQLARHFALDEETFLTSVFRQVDTSGTHLRALG